MSAVMLVTLASSSIAQVPRRAILASFDGFSEEPLRRFADSATAPHIWAMFRGSLCAESVRPAFPSVTPTGHAAIWTGAYANVNGVSASSNGALPLPETTILDWIDGYRAAALRAEPIWITAARQGKRVFSHMATQAPQPPAYAPVTGPTPALDSLRARAARTMLRENIAAVNTYNDRIAPARVITSISPAPWAFGVEGDSLYARVIDDSTVVVDMNHDPARSVAVRLAAVDTTSPRGRPLARFFSAPLRVVLRDGRRTFIYFRLFELSRAGRRMVLFVSEARVVQANRPDVAAAYDAAVQGVPGNGGESLLEHGELGPRASQGGDGTAEYRYMETAELVTRQFMRGTDWGWRTYHPELTTDYLPYPDEALHTFLGFADPSTPNVSRAARENARRMLARTYAIVDLRLEQLQRLAASTPSTRLFVTGEHGMRPAWLSFHPNVVLREAGLLALDASGNIDLSRTRAAVARGGWVAVNRRSRKSGIVSEDSVPAVLAQVERVLEAPRDSAGAPIVTALYRSGTLAGDSLGIGGPGGGDLYFGLAPGYYWNAAATGPLVAPLEFPRGEHGFPSVDRDMHPLLCVSGAGIVPRRIGVVRSIDIAPSITDWLGIVPPADSRGRALIPASRR